jgi:hypothetical protein
MIAKMESWGEKIQAARKTHQEDLQKMMNTKIDA